MRDIWTEFVGQTFTDDLIEVLNGQKYRGCNFFHCRIIFPAPPAKYKMVDCHFDECTLINVPKQGREVPHA